MMMIVMMTKTRKRLWIKMLQLSDKREAELPQMPVVLLKTKALTNRPRRVRLKRQ
jgi:hypothetical protein